MTPEEERWFERQRAEYLERSEEARRLWTAYVDAVKREERRRRRLVNGLDWLGVTVAAAAIALAASGATWDAISDPPAFLAPMTLALGVLSWVPVGVVRWLERRWWR